MTGKIESHKQNQKEILKWKSIITKIKDSLGGLKRRTEMTEEKVNSKKKKSELKDQLKEIIQSEKQKKDGKNK